MGMIKKILKRLLQLSADALIASSKRLDERMDSRIEAGIINNPHVAAKYYPYEVTRTSYLLRKVNGPHTAWLRLGGGRCERPVGRDGRAHRLEPPRRLRDRAAAAVGAMGPVGGDDGNTLGGGPTSPGSGDRSAVGRRMAERAGCLVDDVPP